MEIVQYGMNELQHQRIFVNKALGTDAKNKIDYKELVNVNYFFIYLKFSKEANNNL
jgi:hypothetical protein